MRSGFTLAELLITLGIIGVVAALTMPSLIVKYQKKETAVRLQKAYSQLSQAVKLSEMDNGSVDGWDYLISAQAFFDKYLKNYLNSAKVIGSLSTKYRYKTLNSNTTAGIVTNASNFVVALADGTFITIQQQEYATHKIIGVDVNGYKPPNQAGKDFFIFNIQPKYGVTPYGFGITNITAGHNFGYEYNRNTLLGSTGVSCNKANYGYWCAALIMLDNWEIKDDYPW